MIVDDTRHAKPSAARDTVKQALPRQPTASAESRIARPPLYGSRPRPTHAAQQHVRPATTARAPVAAGGKENASGKLETHKASPGATKERREPPGRRKPALTNMDRAAMNEQLESLQEKLDVLRRDSVSGPTPEHTATARVPFAEVPTGVNLPSSVAMRDHNGKAAPVLCTGLAGNECGPVEVQFSTAGEIECRSLLAAAEELFGDATLQEQCEKGLTAQLQRTRDGATAETRIQELAGLVKVLRRCLREQMNRSKTFVEHSTKYEREATQQVESVKLATESSVKRLEAELAAAKREVAQGQAAIKASAASWQSELDFSQGEVSRLKRELERVEAERNAAREDLKGSKVALLALEDSVRGLKRETGQQLRELQSGKGEAQRSLSELQAAAERRQKELEEEVAALRTTAAALQADAAAAHADKRAAMDSGDALSAEIDTLRRQHAALSAQHEGLRSEHNAHMRGHEAVVTESQRVLADYNDLQTNCSQLLAELESQAAKAGALGAQLAAAQSAHAAEVAALRLTEEGLQRELDEAAGREAELQDEKSQLKAALGTALAQKQEQEATLQEIDANCAALQEQVAQLRSAEAALSSRAAALQGSVDALSLQLQQEREGHQALAADSADKAAKLAQIEGELEALQGVIGTGDQRSMVNALVSRVAALETALAEAELNRRKLHNQLVELRGNIRVFCRVRPNHDTRSATSVGTDGASLRLACEDGKEHAFAYDRVFGPGTRQAEIFDEVADLVQSALDGYKVCLFSYGQTGAGKTYTMQGTRDEAGQGIIPRAVAKILESVEKLREQGWEYSLEASFIEVYNESLRDLLAAGGKDCGRIADSNAIRHNAEGGQTFVMGAQRQPVESYADAEELIARAGAARAVESTAMNASSSRSHSVFMLYISGRNAVLDAVVHGALNLVDLAGSERLARSQVEGQRAKEACAINKSLSSLGDVFQSLSTKSSHVPYRNSKLTHLLQPCLGGSGKTLMFVNINPEPASAAESLCSLRFAAKINACETGARGGAKRHFGKVSEEAGGAEGRRTSVIERRLTSGGEDSRRASMYGGTKRKPPDGCGSGLPAARRKLN